MEYFLSFLEGIITFISPCLLPMLPVYVFYDREGRIRASYEGAIDVATMEKGDRPSSDKQDGERP